MEGTGREVSALDPVLNGCSLSDAQVTSPYEHLWL